MSGMAAVKAGLELIQKGLPGIPMGDPLHTAVLDAIKNIGKNMHEAAADSSSVIQQLVAAARSQQQQDPRAAMLAKMGQQGGGGAPPPPPGGAPAMAA